MKKFTKILILVLSVMLLAGALIMTASAAEDDYKFDEDNKAFVLYQSEAAFIKDKEAGNYNGKIGEYNYLQDVLDAAKASGATYIALQADWECGEKGLPENNSSFVLGIKDLTIDLNGFDMSFSVYTGYTKDGVRQTAYTWMVPNAENVTFVGNGGSITATMSHFQVLQSNSLNLVGGKGGLTLRSIAGKTVSTEGVWSDNTNGYGHMIKLASQSWTSGSGDAPTLNIIGDVTFEKNTSTHGIAIQYTGSSKINIGTEDGARTKIKWIDNAKTNAESHAFLSLELVTGFDVNTKNPYQNATVSSSVTVVNTDLDMMYESFHYSLVDWYKIGMAAGASQSAMEKYQDDKQFVTIKNSNITSRVPSADGNGKGLYFFRHERTAPVCIEIVDSELAGYTRDTMFNYKKAGPATEKIVSLGYIKAVGSTFITARYDNSPGWPTSAHVGNARFTDCSFFLGEAIASAGTAWLPYGKTLADGTALVWPDFSEEFGGAGILVEAGCKILPGSKAAGDKGNSSAALAAPGQWVNGYGANTCGASNTYKTVEVFDLKTNSKVTLIVDEAYKKTAITNVTGINTFDTATEGANYRDSAAPAVGSNLSWVVTDKGNPRQGQITVNASKSFDGATGKFTSTNNKYVTHNYWKDTDGKTYAGDYYSYMYTPKSIDTGNNKPVFNILDAGYYSVDFDLMTTSDKFSGMYVTVYFASYVGGSKVTDMIRFDLNSDGVWANTGIDDDSAKTKTREEYAMPFTPGVWQHLTFVIEMPTKMEGEGEKAVEVIDIANVNELAVAHLYIDGKIAHTFKTIMPNGNIEKAADAGDKYGYDFCGLNDVRMGFQNGTYKGKEQYNTSVDNFSATRYPMSMTADEAAAYLVNAQKALGIEQPNDIPFAVKEVDGQYETVGVEYLADEFIVYSILDSGPDSLTLNNSYYGTYDLDAVAKATDYDTFDEMVADLVGDGAFKIKINLNGHKIAFSEHSYVEEYDAEADTLTIRNVTDADKVTVTFDDGDDATENVTLKAIKNKTLAGAQFAAAPAVKELVSPYAKVYVGGGWATTYGGAALTELEVGEEDITLYPAVKKTVSTLDGLLFNIQANDNITFGYYLPAEWIDDMKEDTIENFVVTGTRYAYPGTNLGNIGLPTGVVTIGEKEYYVRYLWPSVSYFNLATVYVIDYNVVIDGVTYAVSARYEMSALEYCQAILDDATQTAKAKAVAADYLRYGYEYLNALAVLNASETYITRAAAIKAVYDEYKAAGVTFTDYEADLLTDKKNTDATDLAAYADISVAIEAARSRLVLTFKADSKVKDVSISHPGWVADENGYAGIGTLFVSSNAECKKDSAGNYTLFKSQNIKPYNTFDVFTITFTLEDGTTKTGTYSLEDYYNSMVAEGTPAATTDVYKNLFYAMKEFGDSVVAYRFTER